MAHPSRYMRFGTRVSRHAGRGMRMSGSGDKQMPTYEHILHRLTHSRLTHSLTHAHTHASLLEKLCIDVHVLKINFYIQYERFRNNESLFPGTKYSHWASYRVKIVSGS